MESQKKIPAKLAVEQLISKATTAVSHNELIGQLKERYNRVTIYRSLDRLVDDGKIHRIIDMDGVSKYALCHSCEDAHDHNHNHVHFSCTACQEVTCLENIIPHFQLPEEYISKEVNFTVSGICPKCN